MQAGRVAAIEFTLAGDQIIIIIQQYNLLKMTIGLAKRIGMETDIHCGNVNINPFF